MWRTALIMLAVWCPEAAITTASGATTTVQGGVVPQGANRMMFGDDLGGWIANTRPADLIIIRPFVRFDVDALVDSFAE